MVNGVQNNCFRPINDYIGCHHAGALRPAVTGLASRSKEGVRAIL